MLRKPFFSEDPNRLKKLENKTLQVFSDTSNIFFLLM